MPKPVMSLDEFRNRLLLEIWLHCEGDLAQQFDPHEIAGSVIAKHPRAKRSWIATAIPSLERDNLISRYSHSDEYPHPEEGKFYLTERGLRWADTNHNIYPGYQDDDLADDNSLSDGLTLSGTSAAEPTNLPIRNRAGGPIVVGRTAVGRGYVYARDASAPDDSSDRVGTPSVLQEQVREPTYITDEEGNRLLTESGDFIIAEDENASYSEYEGPEAIPVPAEITVNLDLRREEWDQFARDLRELTSEVRRNNHFINGEDGALARRVLSELEAGAKLIENDTADVSKLHTLIVQPLRWLLAEAPSATLGGIVGILLEKALALVGS